jgi:hypothetical protein
MVRTARRLLVGLILAGCLGASVVAMAGADDRSAAESALREVGVAPNKDVAAEPVTRAKAALERGTRMRAAGDEAHARLADSLARAWAEVARDVTRAAAVEARTAAAHAGAADAGAIAERERALLEEAIAQSGRLRSQLEAAERGAKETPARTSAAAASVQKDAGTRPPSSPSSPRKPSPVLEGGAP